MFSAADISHACRRLIVFSQWCADTEVHELLTRLASTIDRGRDELCASQITSGASNGPSKP